jgi:hypothetical protein
MLTIRKYTWLALIMAVIAWLFYVAWNSMSFQTCVADKQSQQSKEPSKKSFSELSRIFIVTTRVKTDCLFVFLYDSRDAVTAVATAFIAIFTLTLWRSTHNLWALGRTTAERQLRAYVSAFQIEVAPFKDGQPDFIQIHLTNHGQTPAHNTQIAAMVDIFPFPLPANHSLPVLPAPAPTKLVLFPDAQRNAPARPVRNFSAAELASLINNSGNRFYVFGVITYIDIFTRAQETHFCYSIADGLEFRKILASHAGCPRWEIANQHNYAT